MSGPDKDSLERDDLRLFLGGACHIFATVLAEALPGEGYELRRIETSGMNVRCAGAYHVVAVRDEFMVDASGLKRVGDYLAWLKVHLEETYYSPLAAAVLHHVTAAELLKPHEIKRGVTLNRWGSVVGPKFVQDARERAVKLIEHWPTKYQVSVLKKGLGI